MRMRTITDNNAIFLNRVVRRVMGRAARSAVLHTPESAGPYQRVIKNSIMIVSLLFRKVSL
jgi:hypothetical protein